MSRKYSLMRAARDHLEQADAMLKGAGEDLVEIRCMIRYIASVLGEKSISSVDETVGSVVFAFPRRHDGQLEY